MQSFRTELENPVVARDIIELEKKIRLHKEGKIDDEKFRSLRLARGVYGQKQPGVQMIRIKIPFGRMTAKQLRRIAAVSDEYSNGNLHATTRQDIQIHYVSLDRTPELWSELERDEITLREACGNTIRNITASEKAGTDPAEPFDVSPYAYEFFRYFLRNPISQDMGRKIKIAFSSSEEDSAFVLIHDIGLIPKIKDGKRGFKVVVAGGLGANPMLAQTAFEFLEEERLIPFSESLIRVFDRYGERNRRQKARMKFLLKEWGLEKLLAEARAEELALKSDTFRFDTEVLPEAVPQPAGKKYRTQGIDSKEFELWKKANTYAQKQDGFYGVLIKPRLGNMNSDTARKLADIAGEYGADDIRVTIGQGYALRFVRPEALPGLYQELLAIGLGSAGYGGGPDITACPGTDTCLLGISSSTGIANVLEEVIRNEYSQFISDNRINIKISGCPNSCGQHGIAAIGYSGSTVKKEGKLMPALIVLLGGKIAGGGEGKSAEKVVKIPSKRGPDSLRLLLDDYESQSNEGEYFADYYWRQGKDYFYQLLKGLNDAGKIVPTDFLDWGTDDKFILETAVGECAGVIVDLFATLIYEAEESVEKAAESFENEQFTDGIYHSYCAFVHTAKSLLLGRNGKTNSHGLIFSEFDRLFTEPGQVTFSEGSFEKHVLRLKENKPTAEFARKYANDALYFLKRSKELNELEAVEA